MHQDRSRTSSYKRYRRLLVVLNAGLAVSLGGVAVASACDWGGGGNQPVSSQCPTAATQPASNSNLSFDSFGYAGQRGGRPGREGQCSATTATTQPPTIASKPVTATIPRRTVTTMAPKRTAAPVSNAVCTSPAFTTISQFGTWSYASNIQVNNNVWGPSGSWSQKLSACSRSSWNVTANFPADGGAIQSYPDTEFLVSGRTVSQYNSMTSCFGDTAPSGGEWDFAYDIWLDNYKIEVMVWNDWTDTGIYPPSNARATTIGGVGYHEFKGGGANEWIYTRDTPTSSGCVDMLGIFKDLAANPSTSGMTTSSVPNAIEYGVEIASTNGTETFQITNATITSN